MVFRINPAMAVGSYKTYQIRAPKTEKTRIASCQAAGCENFEWGWRTILPIGSDLADWVRNKSGKRFREVAEDGICTFTFYPGQECFAQHHVADRPLFHVVRDGDHRGNPSGRSRLHTEGKFWVEDFSEHQAHLKEQIERG